MKKEYKLQNVKIVGNGKHHCIFVDGKDESYGTLGIDLSIKPNEHAKVIIKKDVNVESIELEAEVMEIQNNPINLSQTSIMMNSSDYKERFRAEYFQLKIRMNGLSAMLKKYREGTLNFTPSCSYDLLNGQFKAMDLYASYLEERAVIENINLD